MVYSGKPSTGCRTCRQRRIKCDEAKPTCVQCIKSSRECLGYPDLIDLLFQHQTTTIIKRLQRQNARKKRTSLPPEDSNDHPKPQSQDSSQLVLRRSLSSSLEMVALNFFLEGMVLDPLAGGHSTGHFEYLPKLYSQASATSALAHATTAASLAAFGKFDVNSQAVIPTAYSHYGKAVASLQSALRDPILREKNETLLATLLMISAESSLAEDSAPWREWTSHIQGALSLLKMRGSSILQDPVTMALLKSVRRFLMSGAEERDEPIDPFFDQKHNFTECGQPDIKLNDILHSAMALRPRIISLLQRDSAPEDADILSNLLNRCRKHDVDLLRWASNLPQRYQYNVLPDSAGTVNFPLCQHIYSDPHIQRVWNNYRCARLFLNTLMYRSELRTTGNSDNERTRHLLRIIHEMANEICASIQPQMKIHPSTATLSKIPHQQKQGTPIQEAITAYFSLWPLFVARSAPYLPQSQQHWICSSIREIGKSYHIKQAIQFIDRGDDLRNPLMTDSWTDENLENVWEYSFMYGCGGI